MKRTEIKLSNIFSKNRIKTYFVAVVCSLALLETSCNNNDDDDNNNGNNGGTTSVTTQGTFNDNDRMFIDSAALSGRAEVELGQLAASKAEDNSVRTFGQRMVTEHTAANDQLLQIARNKNVTVPVILDPAHQALKERLSGYSGHQFDTAYMHSQVIDHTKAVNLFQAEVNNSTGDPEVRGYASNNLPILNTHLQTADSIYSILNGGSGTTSGTTSGATSGTTSATTSGTTSVTTSGTTSFTTSGASNGTTSATTSGTTSVTTSGTTSATNSGTTSGTTSSTTSGTSTGNNSSGY
jgi:putative membrane protein